MNIFIVIPAYNEESKISSVVGEVKKFGQVIVVDDGSDDFTKQNALATNVIVLSHIVNRGQGAALQTGMDYALKNGADIIVHFDADGQHDAQEIEKMIKPILLNEADITLGSRFLHPKEAKLPIGSLASTSCHIPFVRKITLKAGVLFTRFISGIKITDTHNGFRALSRKAAEKIKITQDKMAHASEILDEIIKNNLKYQEVPVQIKYTEYSKAKGQSSWNFINILKEIFLGKILR
jgi:glycosyltransferase involved in cell wall biosynthesis